VTTGKSKERKDRISKAHMLTLWEIISDGLFESDSRALLRKSVFFFGDAITEEDRILCDGDYKWLRQIGDKRFFHPNMERMYPLSYLQHMSVHRAMECNLSKFVSSVFLGKLGVKDAYPIGHRKDVFGLFSRLVRTDYLKGETPQLASTFINQFLKLRGDFLADFRPPRWVNSTDNSWWSRMVGFVLTELGDLPMQVGLYHSVRAMQYGLPQSSHNFYSVLEHYNPLTGYFFYPSRRNRACST